MSKYYLVNTPCELCSRLWLKPLSDRVDFLFEQEQLQEKKVIIRRVDQDSKSVDREFTSVFYPHPLCLVHKDLGFPIVATIASQQESILGPFRRIYASFFLDREVCVTTAVLNFPDLHETGGAIVGVGVDRQPEVARTKAVAEAIERLSFFLPVWKTSRAIHAPTGVGSSTNHFHLQTRGILSRSKISGAEVFIPYNKIFDTAGLYKTVQRTTVGMAAHSDYGAALQNAEREIYEKLGARELFDDQVRHFYSSNYIRSVIPVHCSILSRLGYEIAMFPISKFTFSLSVGAVIFSRASGTGRPACVTGSGLGSNAQESIVKAANEALGMLSNALENPDEEESYMKIAEYRSFRFYLNHDNFARLKQSWLSDVTPSTGCLADSDILTTRTQEPFDDMIEVNRSNCLASALGLHVVQVYSDKVIDRLSRQPKRTIPFPFY